MTSHAEPTGDLTDKVALVTGGASGIGRATALLLAARGAAVVVSDVNDAAGHETVAEIERMGGRALYQRTDVTDDAACAALVHCAVGRFGKLDIAFNNAGIVDNPPARTAEMDPAAWHRVLAINLTGIFNCMRHEIRAMQQHGGAIVNTSSTSGLRGVPGGAAYCASKHGVLGLTKVAALEYGRYGIRVNAVCPGYVATPLTTGEGSVFTPEHLEAGVRRAAMRRMADPVEIARLVVWLCSDEASFVTGAHYSVDGGLTAG
jgi:NAD(P)-dependent dehydrogenase (short-subunit alcohol dehydrogenase family)